MRRGARERRKLERHRHVRVGVGVWVRWRQGKTRHKGLDRPPLNFELARQSAHETNHFKETASVASLTMCV